MASSHPAWSHWSDATVLDDYAMTTTTSIILQYYQVYEVATVQKAIIHVLVLLRCRKKWTEHITNGNGSICYQNALNFTLKMFEKQPETRVSEHHKPGFRVWQNERVSPGPGFSKTRVAIPSRQCHWKFEHNVD